MHKEYTFDDFWDKIKQAASGGNGYYHHPCCNVWTSRSATAIRATHRKTLRWGEVISNLDKTTDDKKAALRAKLIEDELGLDIIVNTPCQHQLSPIPHHKSAFRFHQPVLLPQDLQTGPSPHSFAFYDQAPSELTTPSSSTLFT